LRKTKALANAGYFKTEMFHAREFMRIRIENASANSCAFIICQTRLTRYQC
jgi:hypothetical protein